ncbi:MAG: GH3 family domain-containing protein, partial [Salibacteraceae bacterium]
MGLKAVFGKLYASILVKRLRKTVSSPLIHQNNILQDLISKGKKTQFGADHQFASIKTYEDFKHKIPVRDYEDLRPYIDQVVEGKPDIIWPGKPEYFCKTSGTTSGAKYIPISKDSVAHHVDAAKLALLCYVEETGKADFIDGKMIFLQGSPELTNL